MMKVPRARSLWQHKQRCPKWKICHCLEKRPISFFYCCGWYCGACGGRIVEMVARLPDGPARNK